VPDQDQHPDEILETATRWEQPGSDQIGVEHIELGAAVAAGRGARASVFTLNVHDIRWWPVLIILIAVTGLIGYLIFQLRPTQPDKMQGQFNVAVSEFVVQDENEDSVQSEDGRALANYLYQQIRTNFEELELQKIVPYDIWTPEYTGSIVGRTAAEREQAAEKKANDIGAHIIIYGVLIKNGKDSDLRPEFFVNHSSFQEAAEIVGQHELGSRIRLKLPSTDQIPSIENPALAGRVNAVSMITLGLAYYSIDDFENAIRYFEQAENENRWVSTAGKEIIYLLLGNSYVRLTSKGKAPQYLSQASIQYTKALEINPDYGRAQVGLASVLFLLAQGNPSQTSINLAILKEAAQRLDEAAMLENQPESANLETKIHFYQGMIYLAYHFAKLPEEEQLGLARNEFQQVIEDFETGDTRVKGVASHAYARLGIIAGEQKDFDLAIEYLKKAIDQASPYYEMEYNSWLANFYLVNDQEDLAQKALEEAIAIAEANGDSESIKRYTDKLNDLLDSP